MRLSGSFKFMGCEARPGFKDPSKMNYIVGLCQGMDTLRVYVEAADYGRYCQLVPYSDVHAELDYNPVAQNVAYCMRLLDIKSVKEVKNV